MNAPDAMARSWTGLSRLSLASDEIDVWSAQLDGHSPEALQRLEALLSPDEADRATRFYFERDRRRFVVARGVLRLLLARYTGRAPEAIALRYGPNGKPALMTDGEAPAIHFNVTHSDGLGLYAFTRAGEVGIDLERIREMPDWESIAEISFSPQELAQLRTCPPERRRDEFFRAWTRQEAALKALGTGLGAPRSALMPDRTALQPPKLHVQSLETAPGFAAALAAKAAWRVSPRVLAWNGSVPGGTGDFRNRSVAPKGRRRSSLS